MAPDHDARPSYSPALYDNLYGQQKFRLVRLRHRNTESRQPSFELRTATIQEDVAYTALSYVWGPPEPIYSVDLDGHTFSVRKNLWLFLAEVIKAKTPDWFFIDAICIKQNDIDERGTQVRLMKDIYRNADEVRIWIPTLTDLWTPRGWKIWKPRFIRLPPPESLIAETIKYYEESRNPEEAQAARMTLLNMFKADLLHNVYSSRLWIVQELLLSQKLTFQWLSMSFDWA